MNRVRYPYIPDGLVIFEPVRRLPSRPTTADMCGTLPNALYKVLPLRYVYDPATFFQRIARGVATHRNARLDRLIHGEVRYWSPEDPPRETWAFPHLLTMHKHQSHSDDREYRFAFGTRSDVFDFKTCSVLWCRPVMCSLESNWTRRSIA